MIGNCRLIAVPASVIRRRKELNMSCSYTMKSAHTQGTRNNHNTHHKSYIRFTQYLADQDKVPETVDNYVSTVRLLHKLEGLPVPENGQIHYKLMSEGLRKLCKKPVKQADPISHEKLMDLFHHINFAAELEAVAWTAVLVGHALVLRVSNLGPRTRSTFDCHRHFVRADFQLKNGYPALAIRWSKTIQHRNKLSGDL